MSKKRKKQRERFFEPYDDYEPTDEPVPVRPKRKTKLTLLDDPVKVAALVRASALPVKEPPRKPTNLDYPTYSREQVERWVAEYLADKEKKT